MVVNIDFPVFVFAKDCGEVMPFDSIEEIERQLERVDVENGEYEAWDRNGEPLSLGTQRPTWLLVEPSKGASITLRDALIRYGASVGVPLSDEKNWDYPRIIKTIEEACRSKPRAKLFSFLFKKQATDEN